MKAFVAREGGVYIGLSGCLEAFDKLAIRFVQERDAAKRPQSVAELAGELLDAMDASGASLREKLQAIIAMRPRDPDASGPRSAPSLSSLAPSSGVSHVSSVVTPAARPSGAPRALLIAGGALALMGIGLGTVAWYRGSHAETATVAPVRSSAVTAPASTPVASTQVAPTDPPSTSQVAAVLTPAPKTPGVATRTVKPPASHPGGTAPGTAATGTPPPTKADDDIPTMR